MKTIKNCLIFSLLFITLSSECAEKNNYKSVREFLESMSNSEIESQSHGDLNGDGREDWVVVIRRMYSNPEDIDRLEANSSRQIYVLTQLKSGEYVVAATSNENGVAEGGTAHTEFGGVKIKHSTIYFSESSIWHDCWNEATYQFKLYKDNFRLIGVTYKASKGINAGCTDDCIEIEIDKNLLIGKKIIKITNGSKSIVKKVAGIPEYFYLIDYASGKFGLSEADYKYDPCN